MRNQQVNCSFLYVDEAGFFSPVNGKTYFLYKNVKPWCAPWSLERCWNLVRFNSWSRAFHSFECFIASNVSQFQELFIFLNKRAMRVHSWNSSSFALERIKWLFRAYFYNVTFIEKSKSCEWPFNLCVSFFLYFHRILE